MTTLMNKLIEIGQHLSTSHTEQEFRQAIESTSDFFGASAYCISVFESDDSGTDGRGITNFPTAFNLSSLGPEAEKHDPVTQHCRLKSSPIIWDQSTYIKADYVDWWDYVAAYGLQQGASLALHLGKNRHLCLGFMRNRRKPFSAEEQITATLGLQAVAVFAEPAAFRLWHSASRKEQLQPEHALTHREQECLYWVSRGMTDDLIGRLLKISARTVRKHVDNSVLKLLAANRTEAAVTATRLGLWVHGGVGS